MSKKGAKIALTYFITIIASLVIIGGAAFIVLSKVMAEDDPGIAAVEVTTTADSGVYAPTELENRTALFILDAGNKRTSTCFVLARLLPTETKVVIVPLQSDTLCSVNGTEDTLYELYRAGGGQYAKRAVEAACGLSVDKYLKFDKTSFELFATLMGTVNYEAPYSLICEDPDTNEVTVIREGSAALDGVTMRKLFTFPSFKSGETGRAATVGSVVVDVLNSAQETRLSTGMDQIVETVLKSSVETDIADIDYKTSKKAMQYIVDNSYKGAELVLPSGKYNSDEEYVLDDEFITSLKTWFGVDMLDYSGSMPQVGSSEPPFGDTAKSPDTAE